MGPVAPSQARRLTVAVPTRDAEVLNAVRAVMGPPSVHMSRCSLQPILNPPAEPPTMGPTAMRLLIDTLRTGAVRALVVHGGWHVRPRIRQGQMYRARLWDAMRSLELRFSSSSYRLCQFLRGNSSLSPPQTLGDELVHLLAAHALHRGGHTVQPLAASTLVQLAYPLTSPLGSQPRWDSVLTSQGLVLLEGIEDLLATRWAALELSKATTASASEVQHHCSRQRHVIGSFLDAVDAQGCPQAATFLVEAAAQFADRTPTQWLGGLLSTESLRDRSAAASAAGEYLGLFRRLHVTFDRLASVPFFEPEYDSAQAVVERWSGLGRDGFASLRHTEEVLRGGQHLVESSQPQRSPK